MTTTSGTGIAEPRQAESRDRSLSAIALLSVGVVIFSVQDIVLKGLSGAYTVHEIVFIRSLVALPILTVALWRTGELGAVARGWTSFLLLRSLFMFVGYSSYYLALAAMPMADAVALAMSAPLFITALSWPVLGEPVGPRRIAAVIVGFIGCIVLLAPGSSVFEPAGLLALLTAVTYGVAQLLSRKTAAEFSATAMAFNLTIVFLVIGGLIGLVLGDGRMDLSAHPTMGFMFRAWSWPSQVDLALMAATGIIATLGMYCLAEAYRRTEPNIVAPFEYSALLWGILWGWLFWGTLPGANGIAGILFIVGAGLFIIYREMRLKHR
ncbi:MAG: DMT family transporter [Hyphomicrobiaceae bacterium]